MSDNKCRCAAFCEGECACGADWTPSEVIELREQLAAANLSLACIDDIINGYDRHGRTDDGELVIQVAMVKRERDEANERADHWTKIANDYRRKRDEAIRELEQAKAEIAAYDKDLTAAIDDCRKAAGLEVELSDHLPDAGKLVPWKDQPTPIVDSAEFLETTPDNMLVAANDARNLERRMRAAEALLKRVSLTFPGSCDSADIIDIRAHLDAARKEDGQ